MAVTALDVAGWQLQCGEVHPDLIVDLRQPGAFAKVECIARIKSHEQP